MADIHKFTQMGQKYVIDVNSGAVHIVDDIVYDLLDDEGLKTKEDLIYEYKEKYSKEDIEEVYEEIESLIKEDMLYSKDKYENIAYAHEKVRIL